MGEVLLRFLTDEPSSGNRPLSNLVPFCSDLAALRARAQGPPIRRLSFRSAPYGTGNSVKTSDIKTLW